MPDKNKLIHSRGRACISAFFEEIVQWWSVGKYILKHK